MADETEPEMTIGELKTEVDRRFTKLEKRISDEGARTRRHFDVVAGRLEGHLRLFGERGDVDHQRLEDHETRIGALEKRQR